MPASNVLPSEVPALPLRHGARWITGGLLTCLLFVLTFVGNGFHVSSTPFEVSYCGWPALAYVHQQSFEMGPGGRVLVSEEGGWMGAGLSINLVLSVAASALVVTLYGVLRDGRFSIRTLLLLTLLVAALLGAWGASHAHNARHPTFMSVQSAQRR